MIAPKTRAGVILSCFELKYCQFAYSCRSHRISARLKTLKLMRIAMVSRLRAIITAIVTSAKLVVKLCEVAPGNDLGYILEIGVIVATFVLRSIQTRRLG